jgi:hypothetical protein
MTNHELLAGFLDRSLSEDQLLELEARQVADPAFAQEVKEMLTVERLLQQDPPRVAYPVGFLSTIESNIAAKIAVGAASGGLLGFLVHNVWTWVVGGTAAVAISGGAIYLATQQDDPAPAPPVEQRIQSAPSQPSVEQAQPEQSTPAAVEPTTTRVSTPAVTTDRAITIDAKTTAPDPVLKQLIAEYEQSNATSDHVRSAQYALLLGRRFRADGNAAEARSYLESAVRHAQAVRLADYEMDAHGELGLLAKSRGDIGGAIRSFEQAITVGRAQKRNVVRWSQELEAIQQ